MGDFNLYNVNNGYSKNAKKKDRDFRAARAKYLAEQAEKDKEANAAKNKLQEDSLANAKFVYATANSKAKFRQTQLDESIKYQNTSSVISMSEMVTDVVLRALPLDESEFAKLDPDYKKEIRETATKLLENGSLNEDIHNKNTLTIMEYVARTIPDAKVGKTLTEDKLRQYIENNKNLDVNKAIDSLSGNVGSRVAKLLEKEQDRVAEIDADVGKTKKVQQDAAQNAHADQSAADADQQAGDDAVSQFVDAIMNGDMTFDDFSDMVESGQVPEEIGDAVVIALQQNGVDTGDQTGEPQPEDDQSGMTDPSMGQPDQEMPAGQMQQDNSASQSTPITPKKQIQMLPDGTMNINVYESTLVRETPRCGLLETLAVNEARNMLKEGKPFDADTCLAKAVMYVTLTESMSEMGLLNFTNAEYENICESAGGTLSPRKSRKTVAKKSIVVKRKIKDMSINEKDPAKIAKAVHEKSNLQERVISTEYTVRTNKTNSMDLAERLRQKRLLQEQGKLPNNIINE